MTATTRRFPAEWEKQSGVLVAFPHEESDWNEYLEEAAAEFVRLITTIARYEPCMVVCLDTTKAQSFFETVPDNVRWIELPINDTWIRDYGPITVLQNGQPVLLDYQFNGWGLKFPANFDNRVTESLYEQGVILGSYSHGGMILEGGSLESNGEGILLTTTTCLLEKNRNPHMNQESIESHLKRHLGIQKILWLKHGFLEGDDTDSHIDMLARFTAPDTIVYLACDDPNDIHYESLQAMKRELETFTDLFEKPFKLHPIPLPAPLHHEDERLPASYLNFLIINGAVLIPVYDLPEDETALTILRSCFPQQDIIPLSSRIIIRQHGSLHCSTMQLPKGVLN